MNEALNREPPVGIEPTTAPSHPGLPTGRAQTKRNGTAQLHFLTPPSGTLRYKCAVRNAMGPQWSFSGHLYA